MTDSNADLISDLQEQLKAAREIISNQEIRIKRHEKRFDFTFEVLNEALKSLDAARVNIRSLMDGPGFY